MSSSYQVYIDTGFDEYDIERFNKKVMSRFNPLFKLYDFYMSIDKTKDPRTYRKALNKYRRKCKSVRCRVNNILDMQRFINRCRNRHPNCSCSVNRDCMKYCDQCGYISCFRKYYPTCNLCHDAGFGYEYRTRMVYTGC